MDKLNVYNQDSTVQQLVVQKITPEEHTNLGIVKSLSSFYKQDCRQGEKNKSMHMSALRKTKKRETCGSLAEAALLHLGAAVPANSLIDLIYYDSHVFKALAEAVEAPRFHLLELLTALPGCSGAGIES